MVLTTASARDLDDARATNRAYSAFELIKDRVSLAEGRVLQGKAHNSSASRGLSVSWLDGHRSMGMRIIGSAIDFVLLPLSGTVFLMRACTLGGSERGAKGAFAVV